MYVHTNACECVPKELWSLSEGCFLTLSVHGPRVTVLVLCVCLCVCVSVTLGSSADWG